MKQHDNAALKLSLLQQSEQNVTLDAEDVKINIRKALDEGKFSIKDIAKRTDYAVNSIDQVLKNKYTADTTDIDAALIRFWMNWVANMSTLQTKAVKAIHNQLRWAWKDHRIALVIGPNGSGKTKALLNYKALFPNQTIYMLVDSTTTVSTFVDLLAEEFNLDPVRGPVAWRLFAITNGLKRKSKDERLIIVDHQTDHVKPKIISILNEIWENSISGISIALVGTEKLGAQLSINGSPELQYMSRRISLKLRVPAMTHTDARGLTSLYPTDLEPSEVRELWEWSNRRWGICTLAYLLKNAYGLMQATGRKKIDLDMIDNAKSLLELGKPERAEEE